MHPYFLICLNPCFYKGEWMIKLGRNEYRDKVYGCWMGKNIGGTLGAPFECRTWVNCLSFYHKLPGEAAANDDLDLQLVWLKMMEDRGVNPGLSDFADYWKKCASPYPWNEYGFCNRNLARGLRPPVSGCFENHYIDEMGSPIRSEIWACVAPADPQLAASLAWMDSSLDHTGGEGRWGEMFWAAAESAAFVVTDPMTLIKIGLSVIPISCNIARSVREAVWCYENKLDWGEARERIATIFGHVQPCNAIPNHGFSAIGLLYGKDYGDILCKAVNCGFDTDCTGATLGSLLGIMGGTAGIPDEWKKPVGDAITPCVQTVMDGLPKTITELTERTGKIAEKLLKERSGTSELSDKTVVPADLLSLLFRNEKTRYLLAFDNNCAVENADGVEIALHYGGEPVLYPGIEKTLDVSVRKDGSAAMPEIEIRAPAGWSVSKPEKVQGLGRFSVSAKTVENKNTLEITVKAEGKTAKANFTLLGPGAIKSLPAAQSAPQG